MKKCTLSILLQLFLTGSIFSQTITIPYYTGFDTQIEKEGWQQFRTGFLSYHSWAYGGNAVTAPYCLFHDYNVGANPTDTVVDWFVSPPIDFSAAGQIKFKIYTSGFSTPLPDNFEVYFGIGNPDPRIGNFVLASNLSLLQPKDQWIDTSLNTAFMNDSVYVAFRYKTIGSAWTTYAIDNIIIDFDPELNVTEKEKDFISFEVFPNPTNNDFRLVLEEESLNSDFHIEIYDMCGAKIKMIPIYNNKILKVENENLSPGVYFICLMNGKERIRSKKLIIK